VTITVELYGIARLRAGAARVDLEATTLGELLHALAARHPELEGEVIRDGALGEGWLISLDGERFLDDPATPLPDRARVLLLSAQAGG
jgi:molybdopterin converting factor small subunit